MATALECLEAERDENTCRKEFTPSEAVALGSAIEDMERAEAAQRREEGARIGAEITNAKLGRKINESPSSNLDEGDFPQRETHESASEPPQKRGRNGRTDDNVAKAVGMRKDTYRKAKAVVQAAQRDPERFGHLVEEMDRTGKVDRSYRQLQQRTQPPEIDKGGTDAPPVPEAASPEETRGPVDAPEEDKSLALTADAMTEDELLVLDALEDAWRHASRRVKLEFMKDYGAEIAAL